MNSVKEKIDLTRLPKHVAVIMDGNGRWAQGHGQPRVLGHRSGVDAVRTIAQAAAEIGIEWLTLYAFSTENWNRPLPEVNALMDILVEAVTREVETMNRNDIRLNLIGDIGRLPPATQQAMRKGLEETRQNKRMTLTLALNYSGRWEIAEAVRECVRRAAAGQLQPDEVSEALIGSLLATAGMPDPELLIRTSGELRISNYLLWQIAYTELYFSEIFWPDFDREAFFHAILDYQGRERRFGKISEQLVS